MWLLLALSCASLFGAVFAQCSPLPAADFIENRLESTVRSEGGHGTNPNVTLVQHHFTCIAVGSTEGTVRSLSIAVRYNVTSTDQPEVQRISQLLFECSGSNYLLSQSDPFEPDQPESLFNLATRRDCLLCAIMGSPTIDPNTNCAGKSNNLLHLTQTTLLFFSFSVCDAMCAEGQGGCVASSTDCCPFYDVVTRMCITTCPAGSINTTDFTCGKHMLAFKKLAMTTLFPQTLVLVHLVKIKECVTLRLDRVIPAIAVDLSLEQTVKVSVVVL